MRHPGGQQVALLGMALGFDGPQTLVFALFLTRGPSVHQLPQGVRKRLLVFNG